MVFDFVRNIYGVVDVGRDGVFVALFFGHDFPKAGVIATNGCQAICQANVFNAMIIDKILLISPGSTI